MARRLQTRREDRVTAATFEASCGREARQRGRPLRCSTPPSSSARCRRPTQTRSGAACARWRSCYGRAGRSLAGFESWRPRARELERGQLLQLYCLKGGRYQPTAVEHITDDRVFDLWACPTVRPCRARRPRRGCGWRGGPAAPRRRSLWPAARRRRCCCSRRRRAPSGCRSATPCTAARPPAACAGKDLASFLSGHGSTWLRRTFQQLALPSARRRRR